MRAQLVRWLEPNARASAILVRLMVGGVFLSEGIQKFLDPEALGAGRFARIGIPWPEVMAPFVGSVEIACGALVLAGLFTRLAAVPLAVTMVVAIISTKIPILIGAGYWGFALRELPEYGFFALAHEARTDFSMLLGAIFIALSGPDRHTADAVIHRWAARRQR